MEGKQPLNFTVFPTTYDHTYISLAWLHHYGSPSISENSGYRYRSSLTRSLCFMRMCLLRLSDRVNLRWQAGQGNFLTEWNLRCLSTSETTLSQILHLANPRERSCSNSCEISSITSTSACGNFIPAKEKEKEHR